MPGIEKVLAVDWVKQNNNYFCGPAVAHMFLKYFSVVVSQDDLWDDIKSHTNGVRPADAPLENTDPDFDTQLCYNCDSAAPPVWTCWNTTPEALQKTVSTHAPDIATKVRYPTTADAGMEYLIESIDLPKGVPALATESGMSHWIVVHGYLRGDTNSTEFPAEQVGKYLLNALYVTDSNGISGPEKFGFKKMSTWRADFGSIGCDAHPQSGRYPMVVGTYPIYKLAKSVLAFGLALATLAMVWVWWKNREEE